VGKQGVVDERLVVESRLLVLNTLNPSMQAKRRDRPWGSVMRGKTFFLPMVGLDIFSFFSKGVLSER
jgi:hypothetical protein